MNWKLIFTLSLFGVAMAVASVFGLTRKIEPLLWLVIFVACAIFIARYCVAKYFLHGFLLSLIDGIWISLIHAAFFSTFIKNNPEMAAAFQNLPAGISLRVLNLIIGPIDGAIFGVVLGLFAWIAAKLLRKKAAQTVGN